MWKILGHLEIKLFKCLFMGVEKWSSMCGVGFAKFFSTNFLYW